MAKPKPAKADNLVDPALRKDFIEKRDHWEQLNSRANSATGKRRQFEKEIKAAGFSVSQIKISLLVATPEGEAEVRARIANELLAAAYAGAPLGTQLAFFIEPDRTPAVDRAYAEGETCSVENRAAVPPYDPSTPQHAAFMKGFHDHQEKLVKKGIGKLNAAAAQANAKGKKPAKGTGKRGRPAKPKTPDLLEAAGVPARNTTLITKAEKDARAQALAQAREMANDADRARKPSAQPVTRASLAAAKAKATEEAESYFTKAQTEGNA